MYLTLMKTNKSCGGRSFQKTLSNSNIELYLMKGTVVDRGQKNGIISKKLKFELVITYITIKKSANWKSYKKQSFYPTCVSRHTNVSPRNFTVSRKMV